MTLALILLGFVALTCGLLAIGDALTAFAGRPLSRVMPTQPPAKTRLTRDDVELAA